MKQVLIGQDSDEYGYVVLHNAGDVTFKDEGKRAGLLQIVFEGVGEEDWTDEERFYSLPLMLHNRLWASKILDMEGNPLAGAEGAGKIPERLKA